MTKRQITITECDRCGLEYNTEIGALWLLEHPKAATHMDWDLCGGCQAGLKRWMQRDYRNAY